MHPFFSDRVLVEHRAKDIVTGGDGGWEVHITDEQGVVADLAKRDGAEVAKMAMQEERGIRLETEKAERRERLKARQREEQQSGERVKEKRKKKKLSEMGRGQRTVRPGDPE